MSATFFVQFTIKDAEKFKVYGAGAGPTLAAHGGTFAGRFMIEDVLEGASEHQGVVMLEFPSLEAAKGWYNSPEYQALIPTRREAADMVFLLTAPAG